MGRALNIDIPAKMLPFARPMRHKVARGGRGGAKSHSVARLLVARAVSRPTRWLCTREVQKSIKDSVHKLLADTIASMNVGYHFDVQATTIKAYDGGEFLFAGLQDHTVDSVKSYEACDGAWVEEAHSVKARSAEVLVPTIRKEGSEIWWTYNPNDEDDYVHQRFVVKGDPNAVVVEINWRDNPWFPAVLDMERRQLKAINDDLYQHVWEGKCRTLAGLLFKRKWFKRYNLGEQPRDLVPYMAGDYAVTEEDEDTQPDYTELGIFGQDEIGDLYALDWYSGQEDPDVWIKAGVQLVKRHRPRIWFEENGVIRNAVKAALNKRLRQHDVHILREGLTSTGRKAERALGFAARASAGAVWIPNTDWGDRLVNQLCAFTGQDGKTDDMVDVCSLIARGLDLMQNARKPARSEPDPIIPFSRRHFESIDRDAAQDAAARKRAYR